MSLRTKLLVSLAVVIILGISLASWAAYKFARNELEDSTRRQLAKEAEMLARQTEAWLQISKSNVALWTDMPSVRKVARNPGDAASVAETCDFFRRIVEIGGVYQNVNLMGLDAACLASSMPSRIGLKRMQQVVATRVYFKEALEGKAVISPMFTSASNGRTIIAISAPVFEGAKVTAVTYAIIDMAFFDNLLMKPEEGGSAGRSGILDPKFVERKEAEYLKYRDISDIFIMGKKYLPLKIPLTAAEFAPERGIIQYHDEKKGDILAAFHRIREPEWVIVVEKPLHEILAPIRNVGRITFISAIFLICAVFGVVFALVNPRLRDIFECLRLVREIDGGNLKARLDLKTHDEIGKLAEGLNSMADSLDRGRQALEEAERTYRGLFENAVEGIFQLDGDYRLITANPAFARILGQGDPGEMLGSPLSAYFADAARGDAFFAGLQSQGIVESFEFNFVRRDGALGSGSLFARSDRDDYGKIVLIQGVLADITERQKAERERQRAEKAESHLARSRLQALRYQINPHFLFNILNSIDALAKHAPQRIPELIRELSRYLRFTLTEQTDGLVPLQVELDAITSYLQLEKIRFEDELVVEIVCSPRCGQELVPELLIQPLVENAVKYGMKTSPLPLRINIRCSLTDKMLAVEVANTGKWISETEPGLDRTGIGLLNLRQRLNLRYPDNHSLTIGEREGWIVARVELPLSKADADAH